MRRYLRNSCRPGFTLAEVLISLVLVSFVLVALGALLREAVRFYTMQSITIEVQKSCILALQKFGKDLREASVDSLDAAAPNRITFGSPRTNNNEIQYDDGRLMWQKFIRYSVEEIDGAPVLVRQEDWLDSPASKPPNPDYSNFDNPDARAVAARYIDRLKVSATRTGAKVEISARYEDIFEMKLDTELRLQN